MIYLIQSDNFLKIGFTNDLKARMNAYNTHNPKFKLINSKEGTTEDEKTLHNKFKHLKSKTEWFVFSEEIIDGFNNYIPINKNLNRGDYIQVYLEDMSGLMQISSKNEILILMWLWKFSVYVDENQTGIGNMISLNKTLLNKISYETSIQEQSIRNMISSLKKKNLLLTKDGERGVYYLNPVYFFKGALTDRVKCYKKTIEYNIKG